MAGGSQLAREGEADLIRDQTEWGGLGGALRTAGSRAGQSVALSSGGRQRAWDTGRSSVVK